MRAKLIKHDFGYNLVDTKDKWIATSKDDYTHAVNLDYWLSLKNCQEIERGYDLDELAENKWNELSKQLGLSIQDKAMWCGGFKHGLLKLLGDKKYSEEDMMNIYILGGKYKTQKTESFLDKGNEIIQSLQQTEWEVIVEMEDIQEIHIDGVLTLQPKLDADGCLILRLL